MCGRYRSIDLAEQKLPGGNKEQPFVALIDTQELERGRKASTQDLSMIKCFQSETTAHITEVNYGPFDNGHICVGFSTGHLLILSSFDLASIYRTQVFQPSDPSRPLPVSRIIFDPLNMVIVTSDDRPQLNPNEDDEGKELTYFPLMAGLSLIEHQADYKYIQMGPTSYMTLVI